MSATAHSPQSTYISPICAANSACAAAPTRSRRCAASAIAWRHTMFSRLRLRLTLLYLLSALTLVALVGGVAYQLVGSYFQTTTDLALKHKMVGEFQL